MSDVEQAQQLQAQQLQAQQSQAQQSSQAQEAPEHPLTGVVAIPLAVGNGVVAIPLAVGNGVVAIPLAVGNGVVGAEPLAEPLDIVKKIINIYKDLRPKKNEKT
jgi:hypothetical protein